jgi:hypothetical protein
MTEEEMVALVEKIFPRASIEVDNYGQVVIYTNVSIQDGKVAPFNEGSE